MLGSQNRCQLAKGHTREPGNPDRASADRFQGRRRVSKVLFVEEWLRVRPFEGCQWEDHRLGFNGRALPRTTQGQECGRSLVLAVGREEGSPDGED